MHERLEVLDRMLVTHGQPPEILQARIGPLNDSTPSIASQLPPVLMCRYGVVASLRDDRLNLTLDQRSPCLVAVIAAVCGQPLQLMWVATVTVAALHPDVVERAFEEFDLGRGSLLPASSDRRTLAICNHTLRPLAAIGLAHTVVPYFAVTNMPSTQHSFQRIFMASSSWSSNMCQRFNNTPDSVHSHQQQWTALSKLYLGGSALHGSRL